MGNEGYPLRAAMGARIHAALAEPYASFAEALITGERSGLDKDMREALRLTGIAQLVLRFGYGPEVPATPHAVGRGLFARPSNGPRAPRRRAARAPKPARATIVTR